MSIESPKENPDKGEGGRGWLGRLFVAKPEPQKKEDPFEKKGPNLQAADINTSKVAQMEPQIKIDPTLEPEPSLQAADIERLKQRVAQPGPRMKMDPIDEIELTQGQPEAADMSKVGKVATIEEEPKK